MGHARALCARRRYPRNSALSAGFLHFSPPTPVFAGAAATPLEGAPGGAAVPLELLRPAERAAQVALMTGANLVNGALLGGVFGLLAGGWSKRTFAGAFAEMRTNARTWGFISGTYAGLQMSARAIRGVDDRFNAVIGACGSGAAFSSKNGPRAALQGCVSFAAFSFLIDVMTTPKEAEVGKEDPMSAEVILRKK